MQHGIDIWGPCTADPHRGVAFFNGIFIETDPMNDPRPDRVYPVYEDEQVFACRLFERRFPAFLDKLNKKAEQVRVLDVGTGSGVFAIFAAKMGCMVRAIDTFERSRIFAEHNSKRNGISLTAVLKPKSIVLEKVQSYEDFYNYEKSIGQQYDIIHLNLPFTPSPTEPWKKIVYSETVADIDDRNAEEKIKLAPRLLAKKGICLGVTMTALHSPEHAQNGASVLEQITTCEHLFQDDCARNRPLLIQRFRDAFQGSFSFHCIPIVHTDESQTEIISTKLFLDKLYRHIQERLKVLEQKEQKLNLSERKKSELKQQKEWEAWRKEVVKSYPMLAYFYFETCMSDREKMEARAFIWRDNTDLSGYPFHWADRIDAHRAQIEWAHNTKSFPMTPLAFGIDVPPSGIMGDERRHKADRQDRQAVGANLFELIDNRINRREMGHFFPVVGIGSLPVFGSFDLEQDTGDEVQLWVEGESDFSDDPSKSLLSGYLLRRWLQMLKACKNAAVPLATHPAFVGIQPDFFWKWSPYLVSEAPFLYFDKKTLSGVQQFYDKIVAKLGKIDDILPQDFDETKRYGYVFISARHVGGTSKELRDRIDEMNKQAQSESLDHFYCRTLKENHYATHQVLHDGFMKVLGRQKYHGIIPKKKNARSLYFSMPLGLIHPSTSDDTSIPYTYRGAVWILLLSKGDLTVEHHQVAQRLIKTVWTLAAGFQGEKGNRKAIDFYHRSGSAQTSINFAHEIKKVVGSLTNRWIVPADDLFDVKWSADKDDLFAGPGPKKLGELILAKKAKPFTQEMGIAPFYQYVISTGLLMNFWADSDMQPDQLFAPERNPRTIYDLVTACWKVSVRSLIIFAQAREASLDPSNIIDRYEYMKEFEQLFSSAPEVTFGLDTKFPEINWKEEPIGSYTIRLTRVLVLVLSSCVKYGHPAKPAKVRISHLGDNFYSFNMRNLTKGDEIALLSELLSQGNFQHAERISMYLEQIQQASFTMSTAQLGEIEISTSTRDTVAGYLCKLNGRVIKWPSDKVSDGQDFELEISFRYPPDYTKEG